MDQALFWHALLTHIAGNHTLQIESVAFFPLFCNILNYNSLIFVKCFHKYVDTILFLVSQSTLGWDFHKIVLNLQRKQYPSDTVYSITLHNSKYRFSTKF